MAEYSDILKQFGESLLIDVKSVSKGFAPTVELDVSEKSFEIKASPYIGTLIHGRKPTKVGASKGSPTLREMIYDWIKKHNITPREPNMTQEALSYAMSNSIHRYGTKLYQQGGGANIFDQVLNEGRIKAFTDVVGQREAGAVAESVFKNLSI